MRKLCIFIIIFLMVPCPRFKVHAAAYEYKSYKDIPGVTDEMIEAVESLKQNRESFTYGSLHTTETFAGSDGQIHGFTALFCDYLSGLFGVPFVPAIYEWEELLAGLENFSVDFSGELTGTDERRRTYYMTDGITMRTINYFYLNGDKPPTDIMQERPLRLVSFAGEYSMKVMEELYLGLYEHRVINSFEEAYALLESGEADAYVSGNTAEASISSVGPVKTEEVYPLMYATVSMVTQDASLEPVIAVVQKLLESPDASVLTDLYGMGQTEYKRHQFSLMLTAEEKEYLAANSGGITVAGSGDKYPISFYNAHDKEWQGIAFDVMKNITEYSGLKFNIMEDTDSSEEDLENLLTSGEIEMITGISHTKGSLSQIQYSDAALFNDDYMFISLEETPEVQLIEIFNKRVGFLSAHDFEPLFNRWFPSHRNIFRFGDSEETLDALTNGEIDLAMGCRGELLRITHYLEKTGFKANLTFNYPFYVSFGFSPGGETLSGIVNKAMALSDVPAISTRWTDKNYDYQSLIMRSQLPLIVLGITIALVLVMTMLALTYKNREGQRLKQQVDLQTTRLLAVINSIPDMVFCKDVDLNYTLVNKSLVRYFNMPEDELLGNESKIATKFTESQLEALTRNEKELLEQREVIREEQQLPDGEGGVKIFETVKVPIIQDHKVTGLLGIARDITARKKAEQGVRAASESKTIFLANMSHEIRTPMNSIVGFSELALSDDVAPRTRDYLGKIIENAEWLLHIIDDILDISKIESGKLSIKNVPFELRDVFTRCRTTIAPAAAEKGVKLYCYAEPALGRRLVGDPVRLRQVLNNILSNAVKFTQKGTVKVSSSVRIADGTHAAVLFEVKDSGIGISPEQIGSIFEPFMQADSGITRKYGGTGLGLTIAKSIIEMMGGKLQVESVLGVGSRFFFELIFDTVEIDAEQGRKKQTASDTNIPKPNFNAHILLCEDNAMNQLVITEHLQRVGISTTVAENGRVGVDTVKRRADSGEKPFDLIFMDIHMPEMDGMEAASHIIKLETGAPIVALTANIMSNDIEMYKENGMPDCLGKPFTSQELWKCLLKYLKPCRNDETEKLEM